MSSSSNSAGDDSDTKAGHPPALRVGNMRVSRKSNSETGSRDSNEAHDPAPVDQSTGAFVPHNAQRQLIAPSGPQEVEKRETQHDEVEAVKHFHEKPRPTHEKPPNNVNMQKSMPIQQPK